MAEPIDSRCWTELSDSELFLAYREGFLEAIEELLRRYAQELYNYLRRYLGDPTLADDAFQQTFLQVHVKKSLYDPTRPLRPWLYAIATNQAIDLLRGQRRHQAASLDAELTDNDGNGVSFAASLSKDEPDPTVELQLEEHKEWLRAALEQLPAQLKAVVLMAYYQGLKQREIAEALNIPVGTVKSRLHAAVQRLAEMWRRREQRATREAVSRLAHEF
jgi:RNA polymerase sigma-70 factor (ECF subfamily)